MNGLVALRAKHDENVANLDVAKISLADVSHELAKAKHELELVKDAPVVSDVFECDECPIFKSDLASLQSKFANVVCELEEMKSRPVLLGACKLCPMLRSELEEKNALIKPFGKTLTGCMVKLARLLETLLARARSLRLLTPRMVCLKNHRKHLRRTRFGFQSPMS